MLHLLFFHWQFVVMKLMQTLIVLPTKHVGVLKDSFKRVRAFQIELECESVGFWGEGKNRVPGEKPLGVREGTKKYTAEAL